MQDDASTKKHGAPARRRGTSPTARLGGFPARPWEVKALQLLLAVFLLLASGIITVGFGHGGMVLGLAPFLSPVAAAIAITAAAALVGGALILDAPRFAVLCGVLALPILCGLAIFWSTEGFDLFSFGSAVPFLAVCAGIVARGWRAA